MKFGHLSVVNFFAPAVASIVIASLLQSAPANAADARTEAIERVGEDVRYLASDKLEGRGIQTDGIHLAADHILKEYRQHGLKPAMPDGTFKQAFDISVGKTDVTDDTAIVLTDAEGNATRLKVSSDFQPLRRGHNGRGSGELVFIGYGITSADDDYDEYADVDVEGKILVMIRREPQQGQSDGAFKGRATSQNAYVDRKLSLAKQHKAAGVLFVNDPFTVAADKDDELSVPTGFGTSDSGIPFAHVRQRVIDKLLASTPLKQRHEGEIHTFESLREVANFIDSTLQPVSQAMTGWSAEMITRFDSKSVTAYNLIGMIEGEGPLSDETLVIGGHYDHLGYGGYGSRAKDRTGQIHNGADDNATGTAAVLELMRRMAGGPKPKRRILFICFSGEERGLLGSSYYVRNPVFPLENTIAMLNYDMIGTLRNNRVEVNGVNSAVEFRDIVKAADLASPLETKMVDSPFGGSDHLPFFRKKIPVMFCFTGVTPRYHTPDDDYSAVNVAGVVDIIDLSEHMLRSIVNMPEAPEFQQVARNGRVTRKIPYLGIVPNLGADANEQGVPIQAVRPDSPASKAGLQVGDSIVKMNDSDIDEYSDLTQFMQRSKENDVVTIDVQRNSVATKLQAVLGKSR